MAYIHAELHLAGRIYSLAACTFSFRQGIDQWGRPNSKVVGEPLLLLLDGDDTSELTEWATMPDSLRSGEIIFLSADATLPRRILTFKDARCVQQHISLVPGLKVAAHQCLLVLSAQELEIDGQVLEQRWNRPPKTRPKAGTKKAAPPATPTAALAAANQAEATALLPSKQERYTARRNLMRAAENKLGAVAPGLAGEPEANAQQALTRLERNNVAVERARLSGHVYNSDKIPPVPEPEGWHMLDADELSQVGASREMLTDPKTGFKAAIYQSSFEELPKLVVAYAGTEDKPDILADLRQGIGLEEKQYNQAMNLAKAVVAKVGKDEVETTGHSLGGGLASAGSVVTGTKSYSFNAAGLHVNTIKRAPYNLSRAAMAEGSALIEAYRSTSDPLNNVQNAVNFPRGFVLPKALGVSRPVTPAPQWQHQWRDLAAWNPVKPAIDMALHGHGIAPQMVDHIEHEKDQDVGTLTSYLQR
ncbi:MAG TPA: type VI secretion system tube protein TssD [Hymenobacter sp.]|nr:type VI secretion system tube protein TssD [Hymenobacter sp.]